MGNFWTSDIRLRIRVIVFYSIVVNAIVSGLEALTLSRPEVETLNAAVVHWGRVSLKGEGTGR